MKNSYDIQRFVDAHNTDFEKALTEVRNGKKTSHWMWYIFPQIKGLGKSSISQYYAIKDINEAKEYIKNQQLHDDMYLITNELLRQEENNPTVIFGRPDDRKLQSSMTLFSIADADNQIYEDVLNKFYNGKKDNRTLYILKNEGNDVIRKNMSE